MQKKRRAGTGLHRMHRSPGCLAHCTTVWASWSRMPVGGGGGGRNTQSPESSGKQSLKGKGGREGWEVNFSKDLREVREVAL